MSYDKVIIAHFPNQNKITELSFMYFFQFMMILLCAGAMFETPSTHAAQKA